MKLNQKINLFYPITSIKEANSFAILKSVFIIKTITIIH